MASYLAAADVQMKVGDVRIGGQPRQHRSVTTKRLKKKTRVKYGPDWHGFTHPDASFVLSSQQTWDKRAATRVKKWKTTCRIPQNVRGQLHRREADMSEAEGRAEELTEQRQRILHFPVKSGEEQGGSKRSNAEMRWSELHAGGDEVTLVKC